MNKSYIIIGGTSGIGLELAQSLINEGHSVTTVSRRDTGPNGATHIACDVLENDIPVDEFTGPYDGLVYCPGSINLKPLRSLKLSDFEEDWRINVLGAVKSIQALLPKLKKDNASIILFSTVAVQQGMPFHASVASAKGAIEGLTRALAAELAPGIRVNCVAPSITDTPMASRLLSNDKRRESSAERHPLKKVGSPADIASLVSHLLSDNGSWITGQIIGIDGGMSSVRV